MNISVNNKQWSRVQLSAGFSCLTPQTQGGFYYSRTDLGTDVSNLGKRLDVVSFSRPLGVTLTAPIDIWVLSTEDEGLISYETQIVSGPKVIFVNTGGGGGGGTGPSGTYTFNNPLSETGGIVNLNFDTNGLKLQNGRLTLDLTTDPNFTFVQNEIANINQDINALEAQDRVFENDINALKAQDTTFTNNIASINTKIGTATLQTTAKDLSGAINELNAGITQNALTFTAPLSKAGNTVSLAFENDLKLNATGDKLTLNLSTNSDFRSVLLDVSEALKIADYTSVGRVMPMQNHFILNALNGELTLDLSPTSVLSTTFATKTTVQGIETKVNSNTQNIARIDNEIATISNDIIGLETDKADAADLQTLEGKVNQNETNITQLQKDVALKANANDVYTKREVYTKLETDGLLANKVDSNNFNTLEGRVTTAEGTITQNSNKIQTLETNYTTLDNSAVKIGNVNQDIDGLKKFLKEVEANNISIDANGANYGAVNIKANNGYYSVTDSTAATLLMALGFVDGTNNVRIKNLAGGIVTFNTLARYETTLTPTDDKDLVPLAELNKAKAELLALIQGSQGGLTFIGEIQNTKDQVVAQPDLLTQFVQTVESRQPRKGDFIRTTDSFGFIYNGTDWRNFGQVSVSVATTTSAGIIMLGTNDGELQDIGNGKAKVIGWDAVKQALRDLDTRITTNTQGLQTANQNIASNTQAIATNTQNIANNTQAISANTQALANKANTSDVVLLTGDQTITGVKKFHSEIELGTKVRMGFGGNTVLLSPEDDSTKTLKFRDTNIGSNNKFNIDLENTSILTGIKDPTSARDAIPRDWANNQYIPKVTTTADNSIQVTADAQKMFNFDYVWDDNQSAYRNWSGIKLRCKTNSAAAFTTMWKLEYHNEDSLGIFMECVGNKLTFANPTKIHSVSCEDADSDDTVVNKLYLNTKLTNSVGTLTNLTTTNKTNLVLAINEVNDKTSTIGDLTALTTVEKSNIVLALNEVKGETDTNKQQIQANSTAISNKADSSSVGTLSTLTTNDKSNLVNAINEVNGKTVTNAGAIGTLGNLTTTNKNNLVEAINELEASKSGFVDLTSQQIISGEKDFTSELRANNIVAEENVTGGTLDYGAVNINNQDGYYSITENGAGTPVNILAKIGFADNTHDLDIQNLSGDKIVVNKVVRYKSVINPTDDMDLVPLKTLKDTSGDLSTLTTTNKTNLVEAINEVNDGSAKLAGNNTFTGNNEFNGGFKIQSANNPAFELKDTGGNKSCIIQTIDSGQNLQFTLPSGGAVQFNGTLRYPWNAIPTVTNDNDIPSYKQVKDEFATIANLNTKANDSDVVKLTGDQTITGVKKFHSDVEFGGTIRAGWSSQSLLFTPEDDSTKTLKFRDTSVGTNNKFNLDLENVCGLTGIKDPASARDAVPRDWANNQYIPKVTTTAENGIQVTSNAQKVFNFDYVWDNANSGYRNWSGIKLRCKAQSASAFTDMFYLEYRNDDSLGIFMTCVSNKLTFANPSKVKGVSCEDADTDDTATSKGWIQTNYKKTVVISAGGSLPAQTNTDTMYFIEV